MDSYLRAAQSESHVARLKKALQERLVLAPRKQLGQVHWLQKPYLP